MSASLFGRNNKKLGEKDRMDLLGEVPRNGGKEFQI